MLNNVAFCRSFMFIVLLSLWHRNVEAQVTIRGVARDFRGNKVAKPGISVTPEGTKFEVQYQEDRSFVIRVQAKTSNIGIVFKAPLCSHTTIYNLSTTKGDDHVINPVLLNENGPVSYPLIIQQIGVYESIFLQQFGSDPTAETHKRLNKQYRQLIRQIPDPGRMSQYPANSLQLKVLRKMTPYQRSLISYKLRHVEMLYDGLAADVKKGCPRR